MPNVFLDDNLLKNSMYTFMENVYLLGVCINPEGTLIYVNPHFYKTTGYNEKEIIGKSWYEQFLPVNKIDTVIQTMNAIVENKYSMRSETSIVKKDGTQLIVEWHNVPIVDNDKVVYIVSLGIDVTARNEVELLLKLNEKTMRERAEMYEKQNKVLEDTKKGMLNLLDDAKQLEEALQHEKKSVELKVDERTKELNEEKARLVSSINSFPSGFVVTDTEGNVVLTNNLLNEIFKVRHTQWTLSEIAGYLEGATDFTAHYRKCTELKEPVLIKDIDIGRRYIELYIAPIFLSPLSDNTIGNIILITDITEEKILERSKDEFFSIASHELRTPLTAIRGNIELIKKHYLSKVSEQSFTEMIDDIGSSSDRLIELVNEFLNMSRLEQGKIKFEKELFDLDDLIDGVVFEMQSSAKEKGLFLKYENKNEKLPRVIADSNRVKEVLLNLVSNAIVYSDKGGITVISELADSYIKVSVNDTGRGISPQNQNLLFRKFQQANPSLYARDSSKSSGLGLYISKLMVEAMGGKIYLEWSQEGAGSTFTFTLPVSRG
ncbi:PAS domain S-box protein [candidate division WWE3 bacterium]|uniref:histidine kinase n=1 Tax=candidate division WWE3 bacterium TaxID=2053526 RepID=A0A3A4ZMC2_UNCKA|nr:MAG: PAS domain S-box protein [candidate division WWE3 bacterium]